MKHTILIIFIAPLLLLGQDCDCKCNKYIKKTSKKAPILDSSDVLGSDFIYASSDFGYLSMRFIKLNKSKFMEFNVIQKTSLKKTDLYSGQKFVFYFDTSKYVLTVPVLKSSTEINSIVTNTSYIEFTVPFSDTLDSLFSNYQLKYVYLDRMDEFIFKKPAIYYGYENSKLHYNKPKCCFNYYINQRINKGTISESEIDTYAAQELKKQKKRTNLKMVGNVFLSIILISVIVSMVQSI